MSHWGRDWQPPEYWDRQKSGTRSTGESDHAVNAAHRDQHRRKSKDGGDRCIESARGLTVGHGVRHRLQLRKRQLRVDRADRLAQGVFHLRGCRWRRARVASCCRRARFSKKRLRRDFTQRLRATKSILSRSGINGSYHGKHNKIRRIRFWRPRSRSPGERCLFDGLEVPLLGSGVQRTLPLLRALRSMLFPNGQ